MKSRAFTSVVAAFALGAPAAHAAGGALIPDAVEAAPDAPLTRAPPPPRPPPVPRGKLSAEEVWNSPPLPRPPPRLGLAWWVRPAGGVYAATSALLLWGIST